MDEDLKNLVGKYSYLLNKTMTSLIVEGIVLFFEKHNDILTNPDAELLKDAARRQKFDEILEKRRRENRERYVVQNQFVAIINYSIKCRMLKMPINTEFVMSNIQYAIDCHKQMAEHLQEGVEPQLEELEKCKDITHLSKLIDQKTVMLMLEKRK